MIIVDMVKAVPTTHMLPKYGLKCTVRKMKALLSSAFKFN